MNNTYISKAPLIIAISCVLFYFIAVSIRLSGAENIDLNDIFSTPRFRAGICLYSAIYLISTSLSVWCAMRASRAAFKRKWISGAIFFAVISIFIMALVDLVITVNIDKLR
jgi:hypothetical protein